MHRGLVLVFSLIWLCIASAAAADRLQPLDASGLQEVLDAERGNVVLVNFWATWCRPCLKEIPDLISLEQVHADAGFRLVAISLDDAASLETVVEPFMQQWFPDFESYASLESQMDAIVSVIDPAWNEVLPTSYLLDRDGGLAEILQGGKSREEFGAAIESLVAAER